MLLYMLLTQMFPMVLLSIPYFLLITRAGRYNTYGALILAYTSFALTFFHDYDSRFYFDHSSGVG